MNKKANQKSEGGTKIEVTTDTNNAMEKPVACKLMGSRVIGSSTEKKRKSSNKKMKASKNADFNKKSD